MKDMYQIDMEKTQYSKLLSEIPQVDIVITMGCNVNCPAIPCEYREDWGLSDPTGKNDVEFSKVIHSIHTKILELTENFASRIYFMEVFEQFDTSFIICSVYTLVKKVSK